MGVSASRRRRDISFLHSMTCQHHRNTWYRGPRNIYPISFEFTNWDIASGLMYHEMGQLFLNSLLIDMDLLVGRHSSVFLVDMFHLIITRQLLQSLLNAQIGSTNLSSGSFKFSKWWLAGWWFSPCSKQQRAYSLNYARLEQAMLNKTQCWSRRRGFVIQLHNILKVAACLYGKSEYCSVVNAINHSLRFAFRVWRQG